MVRSARLFSSLMMSRSSVRSLASIDSPDGAAGRRGVGDFSGFLRTTRFSAGLDGFDRVGLGGVRLAAFLTTRFVVRLLAMLDSRPTPARAPRTAYYLGQRTDSRIPALIVTSRRPQCLGRNT